MAPNSSNPEPVPVVGRLCYGTYWKIDPAGIKQWDATQLLYSALKGTGKVQEDDELADHIDVLCEDYNADVTIMDNVFTVFFGAVICDISTAENKFNEMALLSVMDLKQGVLRDDIKKNVKDMIEKIPYGLREQFSRPSFFIAWGRV